eukprot:TRINITY_DN30434_c0_g1_i1.p1 TRINITY_DN30434_c0_g1~~TRINITY_DN30434_c0_g1_i1.p1  ORF type:complete len:521 (+),score=72.81 TRINITY_DN30434_c0_g1_i1:44-1606(+)
MALRFPYPQPSASEAAKKEPAAPAPLSARERKHVYMSSSIFEGSESARPAGNPYDQQHQRRVADKLSQQRRTTPQRRELVMPSPRDCKATFLHGNGAVQVGNHGVRGKAASPQAPEVVCFGDAGRSEPMPVVSANRETNGDPREYWGSSTALDWTDHRGETLRSQAFKDSRQKLDAGELKRHELSSEVFGSSRMVNKSTENPSSEITSKQRQDVRSLETLIHRRPSHEPSRVPLSARQRHFDHLGSSRGNEIANHQLSRSASDGPERPRGQATIFHGRGVILGPEDKQEDNRRRCERNYSDLFGTKSGQYLPRSAAGRSEMHSTANATWFDATTETSAKNIERRVGENRPATLIYDPKVKSVASALPLSPRSVQPKSPEEGKIDKQERACWDVLPHGGMAIGVEVARRRRELRMNGASGTSPKSEASALDDLSATDRKRSNLASGQLRLGTGAPREPHDDGRPAAWTVKGVSRATVSPVPPHPTREKRLATSPRSAQTLPRQDSARSRKLTEMMTSEGIF